MRMLFIGLFVSLAPPAWSATASVFNDIRELRPVIEVEFLPLSLEDLLAVLRETYHNADIATDGPDVAQLAAQMWFLAFWVFVVLWLIPNGADYARWLASAARSRTRSIIARNPLDR